MSCSLIALLRPSAPPKASPSAADEFRGAGLGAVEATAGGQTQYLLAYVSFALGNALFAYARTAFFALGGGRAAAVLFRSLLHAVVRSPMAFFDVVPLGRLTARLSYDTDTVDGPLVHKALTVLASFFWLASGLAVILGVVPHVAAALLPLGLVFALIHRAYLRSGVQLQRLFASAHGPLASHIEESVAGGPTVRAFGAAPRRGEADKGGGDALVLAVG